MEPRVASGPDVTVVRGIVKAAYEPWVPVVGMRPRPLDDDYESLVADGVVWLVGSPAVGLIVLVEEPGALVVENVAVHPDQHGKGVGKALMAFAESRARALGKEKVRLYTHRKMTTNISLYQRLGYVLTPREDPPVVHLEKLLR